jgi:PAS domain S-box-containing protein
VEKLESVGTLDFRDVLLELCSRLSGVRNSKEALEALAEVTRLRYGWDACLALIGNDADGTMDRLIGWDTIGGRIVDLNDGSPTSQPMSSTFRRVVTQGAILVHGEQATPAFGMQRWGDQGHPSECMLFVPLRAGEEKPIGMFSIQSYTRKAFTLDDLKSLQVMADFCTTALSRTLGQDELQQNEALLQRAMELMRAIPYEKDYETGRWISIRGGARDVLGHDVDEMSNEFWQKNVEEVILLHEPPGVTLTEAIARARNGITRHWRSEIRVRTASGEIRWLSDNAIAILDEHSIPRGSVGILQDITEVRRLTRFREILSGLPARLSATTTVEEAARILIDLTDEIVPWDAAYVSMLDDQPDMLRFLVFRDTTEAGDRIDFPEELRIPRAIGPIARRAIQEGPFILRQEERRRTPLVLLGNHSRLSAEILTVPIRRSSSEVIGLLSLHSYAAGRYNKSHLELLDILAHHFSETLLRAQIEERNTRLEAQVRGAQKLESIGILAGGMAHDFNNLLGTVLGNASLLLSDTPEASDSARALREIQTVGLRMRDLTQQLLAYAGNMTPHRELLDLNTLIDGSMELMRSALPKNIQFVVNRSPRAATILADATQIRQAIINIVLNAAEAHDEQSGTVWLETGVSFVTPEEFAVTPWAVELKAGKYTWVEVRDEGCGMDSKTLGMMFDPFFTTKFEGRGLGLAAVFGIVRSHRGSFSVQSQPRRGTRFRLYFPHCDPAGARPKTPPPERPTGSNPTILVIDDESTLLETIKRILVRSQMKAVLARSGPAALDLLRENPKGFDAVLLDVVMPEMNGPEVLGHIVQIAPDLPVIVMSGYTSAEIVPRFQNLPMAGFLNKPFMPAELISAIRQVVKA